MPTNALVMRCHAHPAIVPAMVTDRLLDGRLKLRHLVLITAIADEGTRNAPEVPTVPDGAVHTAR